jgi:two-component system sensor histidine kinase/response regulator
VALTANTMQGDREKCLNAGMDDFIAKPIEVIMLRRALERWVRPKFQDGESRPEPSSISNATPVVSKNDVGALPVLSR